MLRAALRGLTACALALMPFVNNAGAAVADPPVCEQTSARFGLCLVWANASTNANGEVPSAPAGHPASTKSTQPQANPCSFTVAQPQPAAGDPLWQGHNPQEGAIFVESCPRPPESAAASNGTIAFFGTGWYFALLFEPKGFTPPPPVVDPRVLAQQAIDALQMEAPEIGLAPPPPSAAVIGNPVWMWIGQGKNLTGPVRASASASGVTVTAVATVSRVLWSMGDGHTISCGPGTPYAPGAVGPSPDCGYTYAEASGLHVPGGGPWPITAAATWTINWTGGGASGSQSMTLSSSTALRVNNVYVLNQDGGG